MNSKVAIVIPARMGSTRFPNKPLADIHGVPMIIRVANLAASARIAPVYIACDDARIADVAIDAGFQVVMTPSDLPSGSDRVHDALKKIDPLGSFEIIINVQGDMPVFDPMILDRLLQVMENPLVDIGTLVTPITTQESLLDPHRVKAALSLSMNVVKSPNTVHRALYFSRNPIPFGDGPYYSHVGVYAYRRPALDAFILHPPCSLEHRESLEQLRALHAMLRMDAMIIEDTQFFSVDTPADLDAVHSYLTDPKTL